MRLLASIIILLFYFLVVSSLLSWYPAYIVQNATMNAEYKKKKHKIGKCVYSSYSKLIAVSFALFPEWKIKNKSIKLDPLQTKNLRCVKAKR